MKKLLFFFFAFNVCYAQDVVVTEINPALFNKDFSEYHQQTALYCAQLSEIAYWDQRNIAVIHEDAIKNYPNHNIKYTLIEDMYGHHHNQVLLWATKDFLVVAFRGTEPSVLKDWLTDSKYWVYENKDGYDGELSGMPAGHGGFRRSLMRLLVEKKLIDEIKKIIRTVEPGTDLKSFPIYLTGHSLGAALSQLCIVPLKYNNLNFMGAYHFAPPLAVTCERNTEMRENYEKIVYDIVNYKDYVPRAGRNGVAHFGKFYRICDDGLIYKEKEAYVKFNLKEYISEFKLHSLKTHITLLRDPANNTIKINERSRGHFPCMELKGKPKDLCN